jgi:hypothetical protein
MPSLNKTLPAVALGFALVAFASPSLSQTSDDRLSGARVAAIHECNARAGKYSEVTWGHWGMDIYRACMAERGQAE